MNTDIAQKASKCNKIWIISGGRQVNLDPGQICDEPVEGEVMEYELSELAQYLLNPNPITLEEKVIGCRIHHRRPRSWKIKRVIQKLLRKIDSSDGNHFTEEVISSSRKGNASFDDTRLNLHFMKISELLRPYDPVIKKLSGLTEEDIDNINAVCEDIGKNRHYLNLRGGIKEKVNFVMNSLSKKVKVSFNRAYLLSGLFEMRGFNFNSFNPDKIYRLIKLSQNDKARYCVLSADYKFLYRLDDNNLINYMHLFEQSVKTDNQLRDAVGLCIKGEARPLKLFFSKQREQSYSGKYLPRIYREAINSYKIGPGEMEKIKNILNDHQSVVSFNYIPNSGTGKNKLFTTVSVMHDIRALEPIKASLPEVYSQINKKACLSDAGRFYLLDSLKGYQNV